ncbi:hypothetical protein MMC30_008588 [Trapelia coarctata]|nr:hypothetical protein [Trapelia coarctata]
MALHNGPYYTPSSQSVDDLGSNAVHESQGSLYPDLGHQTAPDAQMYALADDALQAHQNNATRQLAGLIQAATAAAGQDVGQAPDITGQPRRSARRSQGMGYDQRSLGAEQDEQIQTHNTSLPPADNNRKRKRAVSGLEEVVDDGNSLPDDHQPLGASPAPISQAASTLFRRSSTTTNKKSTRPPMNKLFTSLELSPEGFLQLQSAAKNYMLHDAFPERRNTVGQRGKTDSELVKLRLWNCVKDFLENEGNGGRFFGPQVPGDEGRVRTMFWPSHKNNIITAVTPLLRRMVTNERQRQYAVETRKPGVTNEARSEKKSKLNSGEPSPSRKDEYGLLPDMPLGNMEPGFHRLFSEINGANLAEYGAWRRPQVDELLSRIQDTYPDTGLSPPEIYGLIATIDYHIRIGHTDNILGGYQCNAECENALINQILEIGHLDKMEWAGAGNVSSSRERLQGMLRDIVNSTSNALSDQLLGDGNLTLPAAENAHPNAALESVVECTEMLSRLDELDHGIPSQPLTLHLNILKQGKRFLPRVKVPADQYADFAKAQQKIETYYGDAGVSSARIMALLPDGLVEIKDDAGWKNALERVEALDWMDGELKVLVIL